MTSDDESTPVLPEWVHDPATYGRHLRDLGYSATEATVGSIGYDAGQRYRPDRPSDLAAEVERLRDDLRAMIAVRLGALPGAVRDLGDSPEIWIAGTRANVLAEFIVTDVMLTLLAGRQAATHTEWGVRYTAPHPEPDRRYPVPSEVQARMLADDPDGCAIAVLREVSYGQWRDAQEADR